MGWHVDVPPSVGSALPVATPIFILDIHIHTCISIHPSIHPSIHIQDIQIHTYKYTIVLWLLPTHTSTIHGTALNPVDSLPSLAACLPAVLLPYIVLDVVLNLA